MFDRWKFICGQPLNQDNDQTGSEHPRDPMDLLRWVWEVDAPGEILARFMAIRHYLEREPQSDLALAVGVCQSSISEALQQFQKTFGVKMPRIGRRKDKRQRRKWRRVKVIHKDL